MSKLSLGAPSLTGKDANVLVAEVFGAAAFPLKLQVINLMARPVVFPEVKATLASGMVSDGSNAKVVTVANIDKLQRFASSMEQVAELNGIDEAFTVEEYVETVVESVAAESGEGAASSDVAAEATTEVAEAAASSKKTKKS